MPLTTSTEHGPSWEVDGCSASPGVARIVRNGEVHDRVHKIPNLIVSWVRCNRSTPCYPVCLRSVLMLSYHLRLDLTSGLSPSCFHNKTPNDISDSPYILHAPPISYFFYLSIEIIFGQKYKPWSSSLCNFLQCSVTSALSGPNTFFSTLLSTSLSLCCFLDIRDKFHTHTKQQAKQFWIQTLPDFDTVAFWRPDRKFTCIGCPLVN